MDVPIMDMKFLKEFSFKFKNLNNFPGIDIDSCSLRIMMELFKLVLKNLNGP